MTNHLQSALDALLAEREALGERQAKLASKLAAVEQGINALTALLADEAPAPVPNPFTTMAELSQGTLPLWAMIENVLKTAGPMKAKDIADHILAIGYQTTSKDFPNVVGTNLRAYPDKFTKLDDGRWMNSIA